MIMAELFLMPEIDFCVLNNNEYNLRKRLEDMNYVLLTNIAQYNEYSEA